MEILIGLIIFIIFSILFTVGIIPWISPGFIWFLVILLILALFIDLRQKEQQDNRWINLNKKILSAVVLVSLLANAYLYGQLYQSNQFKEFASERHLQMYVSSFKAIVNNMERVLEDFDDVESYHRMIANSELLTQLSHFDSAVKAPKYIDLYQF